MQLFKRLSFGALLAICASMVAPQALAQDLDSLATASRQRMLSQRILKAYGQLFLQVQVDKAAPAIQQAVAELRAARISLRPSAPANASALLDQQARLIDALAGTVAQPPSAATLAQAFKSGEELLANAEAMTKAYESAGAKAPASLLSAASRQRMLSQRTAAIYFLLQTPLKSPDMKRLLVDTDGEFKGMIDAFIDHKGDFPGISGNIELSKMQMIFLDNALHNVDAPSKEQMLSIATASDRILGQMDELTKTIQKRLVEQQGQSTKAAKK